MTLLIDAHEDLAHNMITIGRDYSRPVAEIRQKDHLTGGIGDHTDEATLGWDAYQKGEVAVIFSTLFSAPYRGDGSKWDNNVYRNANEAHEHYWKQLELYHRFVDDHPDQFRLIFNQLDLKEVLGGWRKPLPQPNDLEAAKPLGHQVGLVVLMEGADGIRALSELEEWWQAGLRLIGLAWAGTRYSGGTNEPGPLTKDGHALLDAMAQFNFGLDLSHMDSKAALQALDEYPGPIFVSHGNPLALLKGSSSNRHLPDAVVDGIIAREGVIGTVLYNHFLDSKWKIEDGRSAVTLNTVAAHIDYICQRAGDAHHAAIGTDFDGGYGVRSIPDGMDSIADLQKLIPILSAKGYTEHDIQAIFHGNWHSLLQRVLPEK